MSVCPAAVRHIKLQKRDLIDKLGNSMKYGIIIIITICCCSMLRRNCVNVSYIYVNTYLPSYSQIRTHSNMSMNLSYLSVSGIPITRFIIIFLINILINMSVPIFSQGEKLDL